MGEGERIRGGGGTEGKGECIRERGGRRTRVKD